MYFWKFEKNNILYYMSKGFMQYLGIIKQIVGHLKDLSPCVFVLRLPSSKG